MHSSSGSQWAKDNLETIIDFIQSDHDMVWVISRDKEPKAVLISYGLYQSMLAEIREAQ